MGRHTTRSGESPSAKPASRNSAQRSGARPPLPYPVDDGRISPTVQAAMDRRAGRRRSRLAALSAASMLALGGAAGMSMAMADEPEAAVDGEVAFSGGCGTLGLLSPTSKPDSAEVTVTKGSEVRYRNDLGIDAELHVGGDVYDIGEGSTQVFVMNQSAEIAMVPECHGLFAEFDSAQVNVVPAPSNQDESDSSDDSGPSVAELPDTGSDSSDASDSDDTAASGDSSTGGESDPQGAGPGLRDEQSDRPEGDPGPEDQGLESEDEQEVNSFGPGEDEAGTDDTEFASASDEVVAVDPKAVSDGASGLLALLAIVCLVGVSAAVMRTILKHRAVA